MAGERGDERLRPVEGSPEHVEATAKSIAILELLKEEGPLTLTAIADALGHSKSTIHRHLATLRHEGYVAADEEGYRVGLLFLDYGVHAQREHALYRAAESKVDDLAEQVGEKVWLMAEENDYGVFIYHSQGREVFRTYTRVGYRAHLHAFAAGKAVLAHLPPDRVDRILDRYGLPSYTEHTVTDRATLLAEVAEARERGVAFNRQGSVVGVNAVAAPVLVGPEDPIGSICVAGPANRVSGSYLEEELPDLLRGVANEVEVSLEYA
jgi:DNA-binding IclR family transcriptional regulator